MCCNSSCKGCMCTTSKVCKWLLVIGGINWGLVGLSMLLGSYSSWNVVNMVLGSIPFVEGLVYLMVGVAALVYIFGCKCKKCRLGICTACAVDNSKTAGQVDAATRGPMQ